MRGRPKPANRPSRHFSLLGYPIPFDRKGRGTDRLIDTLPNDVDVSRRRSSAAAFDFNDDDDIDFAVKRQRGHAQRPAPCFAHRNTFNLQPSTFNLL